MAGGGSRSSGDTPKCRRLRLRLLREAAGRFRLRPLFGPKGTEIRNYGMYCGSFHRGCMSVDCRASIKR
jgi:hypothetical protein